MVDNTGINSTAGSAADTPSNEIKIQSELINTLYQQGHTALIGVVATATGISLVFHNKIPDSMLFSWLLLIYLLSFIRHLSIKKFKASDFDSQETIKWGWRFVFFAFLSGLTWGLASIIFFLPDHLQLFNILTLIIIAMSVGSLAALSAFPTAYYVFVIPAMAPMVWRYLSINSQDYSIFGVLLLVFLFALFSFSRVNYKMLRGSVVLRFENMGLINQLMEQKEKAEQANISKTKFLAAASHDLRQPLHAIGLFLGALIDKVERQDQKNIVEKIQKSSNALNDLLDSLLDVSKLDAGVIKAQSVEFSLNELFQSIKNEFESCANEKNIRLKFVSTRLCVNTDVRILDRILRNLISNAIRYTNRGGVVVGCRHINGHILLAVYDSGPGIEADNIDIIFQEFYQLNNPERDRSKGLGLGLAIVKRMSKLLGFSLSVVSEPGRGSMFGVLIPDELISISNSVGGVTTTAPVFFDHKTVLVIDDEIEIRESLTALLLSWHCTVISATSGDQAVTALENKKPDIVLADYRLRNNETGNDAIVKVQLLFPDEVIPALIITGDTAPDRIIEANTGGYDILHKPVAPDVLRELLEKALKVKS
jgi:signal transduction histidine kinase/ActR/RegA family two-component response regulator